MELNRKLDYIIIAVLAIVGTFSVYSNLAINSRLDRITEVAKLNSVLVADTVVRVSRNEGQLLVNDKSIAKLIAQQQTLIEKLSKLVDSDRNPHP